MHDRNETDGLGFNLVDNPVGTYDELTNVGPLEFGDHPAQFRELFQPINLLQNPFDGTGGVVLGIASDIRVNRFDVVTCQLRPTNQDHWWNRRLTSS